MTYTFFFPYIPPSGVSSLFAQLAQAIAERNTAKVRLVDFAHGAMARALVPGGRVELVEFERDKRIIIGPGETLVMQAEHAGKMRRQLEIHPAASLALFVLYLGGGSPVYVGNTRTFALIGGMCYTIYLYHTLLISLASRIAVRIDAGLAVFATLSLAAILVTCPALFLVLERPFMRKQWYNAPKSDSLSPVGG